MIKYGLRLAAALSALALLAPATAARAEPQPAKDWWNLRWDPSAHRDGMNAFEFAEDDRRGSDPEGYPHFFPDGNQYKVTMHTWDRDGSDRQRNEVRGMRDRSGKPLEIREDEVWRLSWKWFLPSTLHATTNFSHIWQVKTSDTGTPVMQISLPIHDGVQQMEARYWELNGAAHAIGTYDLAPLQNKWITTTVEWKSADNGYMRWILQDERGRTLVDARKDDIDLNWTEEQYNRPKWGIYRSINSPGLEETYLLLKDLKAWQLGKATPPVQLPPPDRTPGAYEAERVGNVWEGAAEPAYCEICSGGRKVLLIGGNTYDYAVVKGVMSDTTATKQLTVHAVVNGTQTFKVSVNGADAIDVPMTGTPDKITTATVPVPLINGVNQLRFFNLTARAPELDKIVIQ